VSFRVLVIPEDPTHNGYILKPLMEALLADAGKLQARVQVLTSPRLNGYDHAVHAIKHDLPDAYRWYDLWVFVPDADRAKPAAMTALEAELTRQGVRLFCCPAEPEVEIYACAHWRAECGLPWGEVRRHRSMKEVVFEPLLATHGDSRSAGGGRVQMIESALRNLPNCLRLCPELQALRDRIADHLTAVGL
jgi:hypothetical protein